MILEQQQREVELRKADMDRKDAERWARLEEEN
jgi:hypothetical protein